MNIELENHIIGLIYESALDVQAWQNAIQQIVEYTNSKSAIFTALDQLNSHYNFTYTYNIPEQSLSAYQDENVRMIDMQLHASLFVEAGVGGVVSHDCSVYATSPGTDQHIFYERCLKPTGVDHLAGVLLDQGQYRWAILGLHRAPGAAAFSDREYQILKRLGTHLRRSLQIHRQIRAVQEENQDLYQILSCLKAGVLLLDEQGKLVFSNQKAQHILESSKILTVDTFNRLKTSKLQQDQLNHYIHSSMLKQHYTGVVGGVMALKGEHEQHLMLSFVPLAQLKILHKQPAQTKVAIFLTQSDESQSLSHHYLKLHLGLSKREISICEAFVNGQNLEQIAVHLHITLSSVRTYLKNIYAKTQCNSQVELMRLLHGLVLEFEHIA